jgi:hypothetical protein
MRRNHRMALMIGVLVALVGVSISGCLSLTVEPKLDNPYTVTFTGFTELLPAGEDMTVTACVTDENGKTVCPDTYEWYLRGDRLPVKCETLTVGSALVPGIYTLDLIVSKDSVFSSNGSDFEVVEPGSP